MEEEELDLRVYWRILLKGWWILVFSAVAAAGAALLVSQAMTPNYLATSTVLVQGGGQTPGIQFGDIQVSQELAKNYGDLIKTRPILERVIGAMSLPYGPDTLSDKISFRSPRSLIEITVRDPDPQLAARIANTVAQTFIDDFRDRQFTQIAQFQAALGQYGITPNPELIAAQAATLSTLSIVEEAVPPPSPSSPRTWLNVLVGTVLGLLGAGLVIFIREYRDDTIKSPDELTTLTGLSIFGTVVRYRTRDGPGQAALAGEHQHGPVSESYKFLRTNLELAAVGMQGLRALLVTSSSPAEGKTTKSSWC